MDGQRQYPAESDRWYGESDDDLGRVPGQRPGDTGRGGEPGRYAEEPGLYGYGEAQPYADPSYAAEPGYADPQRYGEPGYDEAAAYAGGSDVSRRRAAVRPRRTGKRSGLEMPEADSTAESHLAETAVAEEPARYRAERLDRSALRRPADGDQRGADQFGADLGGDAPAAGPPSGSPAQPVQTIPSYQPLQAPTQSLMPAPTAVYLSRRPGMAVLLGFVAVMIELFLVRVLLSAEFAHSINGGNVIGAVFAMAGTPLVAVGLYGLAIGAAATAGPNTGRAWLRTPLAYLPVGLILIAAAALAT